MTTTAELRALTSARGIAAWLVVLFHLRLSIAGLSESAERVLAKGYLAVDFFFLLSGFVLWLTWAERLRGGGWRAAGAFLHKRIARIWPLHIVVLAGAAALALLLAASGRPIPQFPPAELPLHILLIQNWGFTDRLAWNDPAWSISCELAAYLLFPLAAATVDWRRRSTMGVVAGVMVPLVVLHLLFRATGAASLGEDIPRLGLLRCLAEFSAGTALCALWLRWRGSAMAPWAASGCAAILSVAAMTGALPETLAVPLAFAALLLTLALTSGRRGNPLERRTIHYLGEISYATYLAHFLLWYAFKLALVSDAAAVPPMQIALYLTLVLAASVALHHGVERPAQRRINALRRPLAGAGAA